MGVEVDFNLADVFSYESLVHAVAGAMGSVTAMTVFFPLDTARLRLQGNTRTAPRGPQASGVERSRSTPGVPRPAGSRGHAVPRGSPGQRGREVTQYPGGPQDSGVERSRSTPGVPRPAGSRGHTVPRGSPGQRVQ
nr:PREDICTED: collectin-12-like [Lepisosteus oculatus]